MVRVPDPIQVTAAQGKAELSIFLKPSFRIYSPPKTQTKAIIRNSATPRLAVV